MSPGSRILPDAPYGSAIADWDPFVSLLLTRYLLEKRTTVPAAGPQMLPQYYHQPHQMQHEGPTSFCFKAWASSAWSGGRGAKRPGLATTRYQQCHHPAIPQGWHLKAEALSQPREQWELWGEFLTKVQGFGMHSDWRCLVTYSFKSLFRDSLDFIDGFPLPALPQNVYKPNKFIKCGLLLGDWRRGNVPLSPANDWK